MLFWLEENDENLWEMVRGRDKQKVERLASREQVCSVLLTHTLCKERFLLRGRWLLSFTRKIDLGFALDLVLYPPVVVVDEEDVDGDCGVDEEGHGEEEDKGILDSFLRFLPAYLIVQAKLQRNKKILGFKFMTKVLII